MTLGAVGIGDTVPCVVGALDANGNTISSCGYVPGMDLTTGQMIPNAPTCMAGDTLSFVNGNWVCVPGAASSVPSWGWALVAGFAVLALMAVKK